MSFEVSKILDADGIAPTLVAMDMQHLYVIDGKGLRPITLREGLRLFGYPDNYKFDVPVQDGYDLLGNTVVVPVIKEVSKRILEIFKEDDRKNIKEDISVRKAVEILENSAVEVEPKAE